MRVSNTVPSVRRGDQVLGGKLRLAAAPYFGAIKVEFDFHAVRVEQKQSIVSLVVEPTEARHLDVSILAGLVVLGLQEEVFPTGGGMMNPLESLVSSLRQTAWPMH